MQNNKPLKYKELREKINDILVALFNFEYELQLNGEFDWDFLEFRTDEILQVIKDQGGQV